MIRAAINSQIWLSNRIERLLPLEYRIDGNHDFQKSFAPKYITRLPRGAKVYDIGSGRHPLISPEQKQRLGLTVVGLDIDQGELDAAPAGTYDAAICSDITRYEGRGDGDLVICQALLEHVDGVEHAFRAIASALKPGGVAILFVPSRNAVFARLNLVLPQELKRRILFAVFPRSRAGQGFKSFYDHCTPKGFRAFSVAHGLSVEEEKHYFRSGYFTFLLPLYVLWRLWVFAFRAVARDQAAETFCMALRKKA